MSDALMKALRDPFEPHDIEWRAQSSGKTDRGPWVRVLAYVTNRAIMERLDAVCGVAGWRNEFRAVGDAMACGISIKVGEEWITKWDGAGDPATSGGLSEGDAKKGGFSNAMKRAAVQWGIGRYLYNLEEGYAIILPANDRSGYYLKANPQKHGDALRWRPPVLPKWALPGGSGDPDRAIEPLKATAPEPTLDAEGLPDYHNAKLPGTQAHFNGHGGKRLRDIPTRDLELSAAALRDPRHEGRYNDLVETIGDVLADRAAKESGD